MHYLEYLDSEKKLKNRKNILLFFVILISALLIFLIIFISLKINYKNQKTLKLLGILSIFLISFILFFIVFALFLPTNNFLIHIKNLKCGKKSKCEGIIKKINSSIYLAKKAHANEIIIQDEKENWITYFDGDLFELPFKENDKVKLLLSENFIIGYEVENEEI